MKPWTDWTFCTFRTLQNVWNWLCFGQCTSVYLSIYHLPRSFWNAYEIASLPCGRGKMKIEGSLNQAYHQLHCKIVVLSWWNCRQICHIIAISLSWQDLTKCTLFYLDGNTGFYADVAIIKICSLVWSFFLKTILTLQQIDRCNNELQVIVLAQNCQQRYRL